MSATDMTSIAQKEDEASSRRVRCREIRQSDVDAIVGLLRHGFPNTRKEFWRTAFARMTVHATPAGYPKYGYMLEYDDAPVGVILLVFSSVPVGVDAKIRCSVSSWYVEPRFGVYAGFLASHALRHKQVTYFNVTPDPRTLRFLPAQGYIEYCSGILITVPLFAPRHKARVEYASDEVIAAAGLSEWEGRLLRDHRDHGCICLICTADDGCHPFVFMRRRKFGVIRWAYLAYCREPADFVRFAGAIGRFILRQRICLLEIDSNGPVTGLKGWYLKDHRKFYKGPDRPRLGDLAYSERAMFGF